MYLNVIECNSTFIGAPATFATHFRWYRTLSTFAQHLRYLQAVTALRKAASLIPSSQQASASGRAPPPSGAGSCGSRHASLLLEAVRHPLVTTGVARPPGRLNAI